MSLLQIINHFDQLKETYRNLNLNAVKEASLLIFEAYKNKRRVYTFGNGGSASTAEHFASGLLKELGVKAICLNSLPLNTALANDEGYDQIFRRQLETLLWREDVVVAISYSGKSPNIVEGLSAATRPALLVERILLTGPKWHPYQTFDVSVLIRAETDDIMIAEDVHLAVCHSIEKEVGRLIQDDKESNG